MPLWYPDTNYRVQAYVADIWTPAGMMSGYMNSDPIVISKSAYDDWYPGGTVNEKIFICSALRGDLKTNITMAEEYCRWAMITHGCFR